MVTIKYIAYPEPEEQQLIEFHIEYEDAISPVTELILQTWKGKYFYYALDDIIYNQHANRVERNKLLSILNSTCISLQNNFSISFFNVWIWDISINKISKFNKFLNKERQLKNILIITLAFTESHPVQKVEPLW
jgi:hypothetical protein